MFNAFNVRMLGKRQTRTELKGIFTHKTNSRWNSQRVHLTLIMKFKLPLVGTNCESFKDIRGNVTTVCILKINPELNVKQCRQS